ncbi:UDP-N-acetylmuramate dehydrogenase [Rhodocyclus gracilis]|nr:UDP-N-acetylmuramate dehydrogenase [Rhodocyclus gracilis]
MPAPYSSSAMLPARLRTDADLGALNSLALPARAALFACLDSIDDIAEVGAYARRTACRRFVLGGGSNVVLDDAFDGLVLHMALRGRALIGEDGEAVYVRASGGEPWPEFVEWTLAQGWGGLENLTAIPGSVGAAPIQNIGAYGREVGELIASVEYVDLAEGTSHVVSRDDCQFAYRDSVFKQRGWHRDGRVLVTAVVFRLPKRWQAQLGYAGIADTLAEHGVASLATADARQIAKAVAALRQRKLPDPARLPNAGSFFHNPIVEAGHAARLAAEFPAMPQHRQGDGRVKLAAGWLIEQTGWKGRTLGPVGMYAGQALVLVNHGGARSADVRALASAVAHDVRERFSVELHVEPITP